MVDVFKTRPRFSGARRYGARSALAFSLLFLLHGCADLGKDLPNETGPPPPTGDAPSISSLIPTRTFPGDTVQVLGARFGANAGHLLFAGSSGDVEATVISWADDKVTALVPAGAATGAVRVQAGQLTSTGSDFTAVPQVFFAADVQPLFNFGVLGGHDCVSCHGFCGSVCSGGLGIDTYDLLMTGSSIDGAVVIPRQSGTSRLIQRLLPTTPEGSRMPQPPNPLYMSAAEILLISDWIDQGARNN
jgi:hypothetical protein